MFPPDLVWASRSGPIDCLKDEILSELGPGNVRAACMGISAGLEGLSPYTCRAHVDMLGALAYYISWVQYTSEGLRYVTTRFRLFKACLYIATGYFVVKLYRIACNSM